MLNPLTKWACHLGAWNRKCLKSFSFLIIIQVCTLEDVNCLSLATYHTWCLHAQRNVMFRIVYWRKEFPFFLHHLKATISAASRRSPLVGSKCACAWSSSSEAKSGFYPGGLYQRNENKKVKRSVERVNYQWRRSFFARCYGCRWRYSALSPSSQTETFKEMFANSKAMNKRVLRHTSLLRENA